MQWKLTKNKKTAGEGKEYKYLGKFLTSGNKIKQF